MEGSLELQNGGLRALEEAWNEFLIEAFVVKSGHFLCSEASSDGSRRVELCPRMFPGVQGKARAPEWCPESFGRGLGQIPASGIFLLSLVVFCASVASPGGVELCLRRSLEVRESAEL